MLGWVEGGNLQMDYRFAGSDLDGLATYAEELVNLRPDLIFAFTGLAARAVQQRTAVIPIVFVGGGGDDPQHSTTGRQYYRICEQFRIAGGQVAEPAQGGRARLDQGRTCLFGE